MQPSWKWCGNSQGPVNVAWYEEDPIIDVFCAWRKLWWIAFQDADQKSCALKIMKSAFEFAETLVEFPFW